MGPFCRLDALARPVARSEDEVLLTAPEIDCLSQIAVTEENSSASSRLSQATSPSHIRKIRMLPLFFLRIEIEFYGDLATKKVNTCCTGIFHLLIC